MFEVMSLSLCYSCLVFTACTEGLHTFFTRITLKHKNQSTIKQQLATV